MESVANVPEQAVAAEVPAPVAAAPAPAPAPVAAPVAAPAPAAVPEPEPVISKKVGPILEAHPDLLRAIETIRQDVSGASFSGVVANLFRHVPKLAAAVHDLDLSNAEKRACVIAAAHQVVDHFAPASEEANSAKTLLDSTLPSVIAGVIDVVKGRVSFGAAASAAASAAATSAAAHVPAPIVHYIETASVGCLPWFRSCRR